MSKFLAEAGEMIVDVGLEVLTDKAPSNLIVLPVTGPVPTPQPSSPEPGVYKWIIEAHEKRWLTPLAYDDLKSEEKQASSCCEYRIGN